MVGSGVECALGGRRTALAIMTPKGIHHSDQLIPETLLKPRGTAHSRIPFSELEMRYRSAMKALLSPVLLAAALHAQVIRTVPYNLVRLDPALDSILTPDSPLEILGEHFGLTEGPVWVNDANGGYLLFSDCAANVIYKWQPNAPLSVFLERSGFTGTNNLNAGQQTIAGRLAILLIGSNGLALDPQGRLIITAMADRTLVRLEKDGSRTTLADRYDGKRF